MSLTYPQQTNPSINPAQALFASIANAGKPQGKTEFENMKVYNEDGVWLFNISYTKETTDYTIAVLEGLKSIGAIGKYTNEATERAVVDSTNIKNIFQTLTQPQA
jgi:hypothetical protein